MINLYPQTTDDLYTSLMPSSVHFSRLKDQTYCMSPSTEATQQLFWGLGWWKREGWLRITYNIQNKNKIHNTFAFFQS